MEQKPPQENTPVTLREAELKDIPALLEIEKGVAGTNIFSPMLEADEWQEELQKGKVFLIEKDNAVIGNLSYVQKDDDHVYISGLVVSPEFQGQGIARKILTGLLEEFKNVQRIDLVTHPDNHRALNLYQSLGFVIESRKEDYYGDGEPRLVLVLQK